MTEDIRVIVERVRTLDSRVETLEDGREAQATQNTQILVAIGVLQTRVTFYAAGVATIASLAVSLAMKFL